MEQSHKKNDYISPNLEEVSFEQIVIAPERI